MQSTAGGQPDLNWLPPTGSALATPSGATTSLPPGATAPAATNQGTPLKWGPSSTTTSAPSGGTFASGGTSTQLPVTNTAGGIHAVNTAAAVNNYATTVPPASENPYLLPAGQAAPGVVHAGATAPLVTGGPMQTSPVAPAYGQQQLRGPYIGDPLERVPDRFPAVPGPLPRDGGVFEPNSPAFLEEQTVPFDLRVIGQETQTGRLQLGAGVNSDAGLVGSFVIDERNFDLWKFPNSWADFYNGTAFRGAGQHLRIEAVPGTVVQRYMIQFEEPYLGPTRISFGISGSFFNRLYTEWDEERLGGRVSFGYQFTHDLVGSIAIRMENVTLYNPIVGYVPQINEALGKSSLYGFRGTLSHDTRDNQYLATQGHMFSMSFEQVVGTYIYPRFELDYRRYYKIRERADGSGRHILSLSAQTGWTGSNTPVYEHYFAGGFTTIRGFDFRGASPVYGPDDVVVGGEFQLLASAQYLFPITPDDMLRGVVFCDSGTVEPSLDQWSDKYRVSVGFGLRISVPAMGPAPIALDFAFPIQAEPFDREQVFSFFVGLNR